MSAKMESEIRIDSYGGGFMLCRPTADNWEEYTGMSLQWRRQPMVRDPFPTKEAAEAAAQKLDEVK